MRNNLFKRPEGTNVAYSYKEQEGTESHDHPHPEKTIHTKDNITLCMSHLLCISIFI